MDVWLIVFLHAGEFSGSDSYFENIKLKLESSGSFQIQDIMNAEFLTISRKEDSIYQKLIKDGGIIYI